MDDICLTCSKSADVMCTYEQNACFCFEHGFDHLKLSGHKLIKLIEYKCHQKFRTNLERINKAKNDLIYRSAYLINTIKSITKNKIIQINRNIDLMQHLIGEGNWNSNTKIYQQLEELSDIKVIGNDLNGLTKIINKYLNVIINDHNNNLPEKKTNQLKATKFTIN